MSFSEAIQGFSVLQEGLRDVGKKKAGQQQAAANQQFAEAFAQTPEGKTSMGSVGALGVGVGALEAPSVFSQFAGMAPEKLNSLLLRDSMLSTDPLLRASATAAMKTYNDMNYSKSFWDTYGSEMAKQRIKAQYGDGDGSGSTTKYTIDGKNYIPAVKEIIENLDIKVKGKKLKLDSGQSIWTQFNAFANKNNLTDEERGTALQSLNSKLRDSTKAMLSGDPYLSQNGTEASLEFAASKMGGAIFLNGTNALIKKTFMVGPEGEKVEQFDGEVFDIPYPKSRYFNLKYQQEDAAPPQKGQAAPAASELDTILEGVEEKPAGAFKKGPASSRSFKESVELAGKREKKDTKAEDIATVKKKISIIDKKLEESDSPFLKLRKKRLESELKILVAEK